MALLFFALYFDLLWGGGLGNRRLELRVVPVGGEEIAPQPKTQTDSETDSETENFVRLYHHSQCVADVAFFLFLFYFSFCF